MRNKWLKSAAIFVFFVSCVVNNAVTPDSDNHLETSGVTGVSVAVGDAINFYGLIDIAYQKPLGRIIGVSKRYIYAFIDENARRFGTVATPDGTPKDVATFGNRGSVDILDYWMSYQSYGMAAIEAVAVQSDQKIIVAGAVGAGIFVLRLYPDGSPDLSFGGDGFILYDISKLSISANCETWPDGVTQEASISDIAIQNVQAQAKIVIAGTRFSTTGCKDGQARIAGLIMRFNSNGEIDTTFKQNSFSTSLSEKHDGFSDIEIDFDKRIVVAGCFGNKAGIIRFVPDGDIDKTFSPATSNISFPLNSVESCATGLLLEDSATTYYMTARTSASLNGEFDSSTLTKIKQDGTIDTSFGCPGCDGVVRFELNSPLIEHDYALQICRFGLCDSPIDINVDHTRYFHRAGGFAINGNKITVAVNDNVKGLVLRQYTINGLPNMAFGTKGEIVIGKTVKDAVQQISSGFVWGMLMTRSGKYFIAGRNYIELGKPKDGDESSKTRYRSGYAFVHDGKI